MIQYQCGVIITVPDSEFVSIITEALHMESEKVMWPVYYEGALRTNDQEDPTSFEMLDILMDGRHYRESAKS